MCVYLETVPLYYLFCFFYVEIFSEKSGTHACTCIQTWNLWEARCDPFSHRFVFFNLFSKTFIVLASNQGSIPLTIVLRYIKRVLFLEDLLLPETSA